MTMPTWNDLTDLDKGAVLVALVREDIAANGPAESVSHYPARFHDHPALTGLDEQAVHAYAATQAEHQALVDRDEAEYTRLFDLAMNTSR